MTCFDQPIKVTQSKVHGCRKGISRLHFERFVDLLISGAEPIVFLLLMDFELFFFFNFKSRSTFISQYL